MAGTGADSSPAASETVPVGALAIARKIGFASSPAIHSFKKERLVRYI